MAAVLFTDLVGSTELHSQLGESAYDGLLATFPSAADAVACAVGMQQAVDVHSGTAGVPLAIRVGLSVGDVALPMLGSSLASGWAAGWTRCCTAVRPRPPFEW
jgi:class 3 adenylate cyclase